MYLDTYKYIIFKYFHNKQDGMVTNYTKMNKFSASKNFTCVTAIFVFTYTLLQKVDDKYIIILYSGPSYVASCYRNLKVDRSQKFFPLIMFI